MHDERLPKNRNTFLTWRTPQQTYFRLVPRFSSGIEVNDLSS